MTEAEILEFAQMAWSNFIASFAIGITVTSGYLIVAYMAGHTLSRIQVTIVNVLFTGVSLSVLAALYGFLRVAADAELIAWAMTVQRTAAPLTLVSWSVTGFLGLINLASLFFMWDIRHPKAE
jgi:ABC-type glycerol-3-phosphate transport system permease component